MLHVYMAVSVYLCMYVTCVYGSECVLMYVCYMCIRAVTSTFILYLSKSKSNSRKSYSSKSKSTARKMYLKYK